MDKKELWKNTLSTIEVETSKASFATFLSKTELISLTKQAAVIGCPNTLIIEKIRKQYADLIRKTLYDLTGKDYRLDFKVRRRRLPAQSTADLGPLFEKTNEADNGLFPTYVFENFVVGPSNRLAHAAARSVANEPGSLHNPLLLHAGVGLGKTHLMHAIGNAVKERNPRARICYCSAEHFTNEMVSAVQNRRTAAAFKRRFRSVDLLMIDDIQFLAGKENTQEEFFNTFNELYLSKKQIILTSDRHPQEIKKLEARLVSRFAGGTIIDIQPPSLDLRIAILRQKAKERKMTLDERAIFALAEHIAGSIRQLEGALNQLLLLMQVHRGATIEELANLVLKNVNLQRPTEISPEKIIEDVCRKFGVDKSELVSPRRKKEIVLPRQVAMYLLRETKSLSLDRIGRLLGGRDHSTVFYGIKSIEKRIKSEGDLQNKIASLKASLY